MEEKPAWIPEWAWNEYLAYRQVGRFFLQIESLQPARALHSEDEIWNIPSKIIFAEECLVVWEAINRRRKASEPSTLNGDCFSLLAAAALAFSGAPLSVLIPSSERKRRAGRIAELSEALRDEILALEEIGGAPMIVRQGVSASMCQAYRLRGPEAHKNYPLDEVASKLDEATALLFLGTIASRVFYSSGQNLFTALAEAARTWAQTKPAVYRPNSKGAARTYFVQCMTRHFRDRYKSPLRAQVAALVRCVYEEDIDESTVAKLAP